jgi:hypothetical protein
MSKVRASRPPLSGPAQAANAPRRPPRTASACEQQRGQHLAGQQHHLQVVRLAQRSSVRANTRSQVSADVQHWAEACRGRAGARKRRRGARVRALARSRSRSRSRSRRRSQAKHQHRYPGGKSGQPPARPAIIGWLYQGLGDRQAPAMTTAPVRTELGLGGRVDLSPSDRRCSSGRHRNATRSTRADPSRNRYETSATLAGKARRLASAAIRRDRNSLSRPNRDRSRPWRLDVQQRR